MMNTFRLLLLGTIVAGALALSACKQDEGKTCQTSSDCDKDLVCCYDSNAASSTLGTCQQVETCTPLPDAGVDAEVTQDASP